MNNYVKSSNYYIEPDICMIIKNRNKRNKNLFSNKGKQHISLNYTLNRNKNYNKNRPNTNYIILNKGKYEIINLKNYNSYQHVNYFNNESLHNRSNNMININTIKKSFERLKNKINSLQKIVNSNINNNYMKDIKTGYKSSDKITNNKKNIYNNIYINIDSDKIKNIKYDNYMFSNFINIQMKQNGRNSVMQNVKNYQNYNYMNSIQNNQNNSIYDFKSISKKYNSTNNLITSNINKKNKNKLDIINNNDPLFKYRDFNNYQNIKVNINNKTINESENISEIANNLILLSKMKKNSLKNTFVNNKEDLYAYNVIKDMNDLKIDYDTLNDRKNTISVNQNKNRLIMKQSKENDIFLNPTVLKVDKGNSLRISITTSNNNEKDLICKSKEISPLKIMTNEIINFTNDEKNLKLMKENKMKLLYSDFKINKEISICYNIIKKNQAKKEEIIKYELINNTNNINNNRNDKKELSKSKEVNIKIINNNKTNNINTNIDNTDIDNTNKKDNNNKKQIDKKIKINRNRNNKNIKKNDLILSTKKIQSVISYKNNRQIKYKTEKTKTPILYKNIIQNKKDNPNKNIASKHLTNSTIIQKYKSKIKNNKISNKANNTINNSYIKNKNQKKDKQNKYKKKIDISKNNKKAQNTRQRKQSITSQEEMDDILINQIIRETESKQKQKENLHIQFKLENNTYIHYNQNDLIKNSIYTNGKNELISHREFDDLVYNEILKSKFNLIPIIKKNFNVKKFKINKEYKLNENLKEKEIIPELYQEYSNDEDFKLLEKTLERSIEKTFKRKYEKNNLSLSLSDNKNKNKEKDKNNSKNEVENIFNKIRDMFNQDQESEFENSDKNNKNEDNDDDLYESENDSINENDIKDEDNNENDDVDNNESDKENENDEENENEEDKGI